MSLSNFVKRVRNIMRNDAGINGDAQRIELYYSRSRWRNWAHDDGSGYALTGDELLSFVNNNIVCGTQNIEITPTTLSVRRCKDHI